MNADSLAICSTAIKTLTTHSAETQRLRRHAPSSERGSARAAQGVAATAMTTGNTAAHPATRPATGATMATTSTAPKAATTRRSIPIRLTLHLRLNALKTPRSAVRIIVPDSSGAR
jgi:hypothetical protein